jgi:aminomethyltransferase
MALPTCRGKRKQPEKDWRGLKSDNTAGVEMHDISDETALLAYRARRSEAHAGPHRSRLVNLKYYTFAKGTFADVDNVMVIRHGLHRQRRRGDYFEDKDGAADIIGMPSSQQASDLLALPRVTRVRLEKGFALYGNDIDDTTSPLEAGLGWITKFTKDFTAKSILEAQKAEASNASL